MKDIEERLFQTKDKNMRSECFRERIRVTRFGDFTVRRRLYKDKAGNSHFLLNEYLNWIPYKQSTPSLRASLVELATRITFRDVGKVLENLTTGVLSVSTIHRVLQEVSQPAIQRESKEWEDCFQHGKYPDIVEKIAQNSTKNSRSVHPLTCSSPSLIPMTEDSYLLWWDHTLLDTGLLS